MPPNLRVASEAASGPEMLAWWRRIWPNILLLDLMLPGLNGLEAARKLKQSCPETPVIILSMHADVGYVAEAIRAGAVGYVLKDEGARELFKAIQEVADGRQYLSPEHLREALRRYQKRLEAGAAEVEPYQTLSSDTRSVAGRMRRPQRCGDSRRAFYLGADRGEPSRQQYVQTGTAAT